MIPPSIAILFCLVVVACLIVLWSAFKRNTMFLIISIVWLTLQALISFTGFYNDTNEIPPRIALMPLPPLIGILLFFIIKPGRKFLLQTDIRLLTLFHTIRIPVELCLLLLYYQKLIPEAMTFEGRNFDIISGITAPVIAFVALKTNKVQLRILLLWNLLCLLLLLNVVIHGILSAPSVFQQINFDQPNIAILHFPIVWLPSFVVPCVLFAHLISIYQIIALRKY